MKNKSKVLDGLGSLLELVQQQLSIEPLLISYNAQKARDELAKFEERFSRDNRNLTNDEIITWITTLSKMHETGQVPGVVDREEKYPVIREIKQQVELNLIQLLRYTQNALNTPSNPMTQEQKEVMRQFVQKFDNNESPKPPKTSKTLGAEAKIERNAAIKRNAQEMAAQMAARRVERAEARKKDGQPSPEIIQEQPNELLTFFSGLCCGWRRNTPAHVSSDARNTNIPGREA